MARIYTRTGDKGATGLADGSRVAKHDARVEAYGTVDEANAILGIAAVLADGVLAGRIFRVQNDLFDVGADLARPGMDRDAQAPHPVLRVSDAEVARLEAEIDAMGADLAPLRNFILPGGGALATHLHLARTVTRRAERRATELAEASGGDVNPAAIRYLNRLSDWLFMAARVAAAGNGGDVLWVPGANR